MKNPILLVLVGSFMAFNVTLHTAAAAPVGVSNQPADYLLAARDLSRLAAGVYIDVAERDVTLNGGPERTLKTERAMACVSYQLFRSWLEVYGSVGQSQHKLSNANDYGAEHTDWAFGVKLNLLDHDIMDPVLMEDRIRINALLQLAEVDAELGNDDYGWLEYYAALTVSLVNDVIGNKQFVPEAIAVYAGPIYSNISGSDIEELDAFGGTLGLSFQFTSKVSLDVAVEHLDGTSLSSSLFVRF